MIASIGCGRVARGGSRRWLGALVPALLLSVGCVCSPRSAPPPTREMVQIGRLIVRNRIPPGLLGGDSDGDKGRGWVAAELRRAAHLSVEQGDAAVVGSYRLRVDFLARGREGEPPALVVSARADLPGSIDEIELQSHAVVSVSGGGGQVAKGLKEAIRRVVADLDFQAGLVYAPAGRLVDVLKSGDASRVMVAIDVVAIRRLDGVVPTLVQLLRHDAARVADSAIGALVAIGDRAAVKPLTRLARFEDTEKMAKLIDGIAILGGTEAERYLQFVVRGHPDEDIRNLAVEALQRMNRGGGSRADLGVP